MSEGELDWKSYGDLIERLVRFGFGIGPQLAGKFSARDVVQETLLVALRSQEVLRKLPERTRRVWLCKVARNKWRDKCKAYNTLMRDASKDRSVDDVEAALAKSSRRIDEMLAAVQSSPSSRASREEDRMRVVLALVELPEEERTAITLRYWDGASMEEIGKRLGTTARTANRILHRGEEGLRAALDGTEE